MFLYEQGLLRPSQMMPRLCSSSLTIGKERQISSYQFDLQFNFESEGIINETLNKRNSRNLHTSLYVNVCRGNVVGKGHCELTATIFFSWDVLFLRVSSVAGSGLQHASVTQANMP